MALGRDVRPYFFLSYARTPKRDPADRDDPDRWVYKLYKDLCEIILQMTDALPDEAGFMDRENKLGSAWGPEITDALATCRVFVPLYSRRYFESDYCGREWFAFARREITARARGAQLAEAIVPALWTRLDRDRLPPVAQTVQFDQGQLGERYNTEGFYGIMKLQNYRTDYQRAVHRLAERIIAVADRSAVLSDDSSLRSVTTSDFESLPSAFGPTSARRTVDPQVQIAVLAHDTSTLPAGISASHYGATPQAWSPYQPDYPTPIAEYAQDLARNCLDCKPVVGTFGDDVGTWTGNGQQMPPTLCLVDPWVSVSDSHAEQLRMLNQIKDPWVSVLIPWSSQDRQLNEMYDVLRARLAERLGDRLASVPRRCLMAASGIPSLEDFAQLLPEMTMIMLKRFRKGAAVHPPSGPIIERPRLFRPDSDDLGNTG
ncbi:MAG TPA: TIR-like protein FxsC [Streptosporangiaceae bacterium]|nr:TIR-like protein FxsC [Streptosporangiaceae bacterium]